MLSEIQKNKFNQRAKETAREVLKELKIKHLSDDNIGALQEKLDLSVVVSFYGRRQGKSR